MPDSLKNETITGMLWSFNERFGSILIQFITNIILARLLTPNDFGLIGMLMIFIAISNTIVDSGFGAALIQKKNVSQEDYSTIFFVNIIIAIVLFIFLFISAPFISNFYKQFELTNLLRVLGLVLILNGFNIIQNTQLIRKVDFKKIAMINILSTLFACIISLFLAFKGFGVWSLVAQMLSIAFFKSIFLWLLNSWRPNIIISMNSIRTLFGFGSGLLFSALLDTLYTNIQSLIIGKVFSVRDLGFYTQANKMSEVPVSTISGVVSQVTFPVFAKLQDDLVKMKSGVKKSLKSMVFLNFPIMVLLIIIAKPLFLILFTEKWNEAVPYFQILCLSGMLLTLHITNLNILKATGRSDIFLKLEIVKKIIGLIAIVIGLQFGIIGMLYSIVITSYICFALNAYFSGIVIKYGIREQLADILPSFLLSIFVGMATYYLSKFIAFNALVDLILLIIIYSTMFLGISKFFKFEALDLFLSVIKERIFKSI